MLKFRLVKVCLSGFAVACALAAQSPKYGVGRPPVQDEIRSLGVAIAPDGGGLPEGSGTVAAGREVYTAHCARCHGANAEGGIAAALTGGQGSLATAKPVKTVGSFWPYSTTVWDYVNRAMPFDRPGVLKAGEVYAVVAYVLNINGIIRNDEVMDARSLPKVKMPNRDGFVGDPRPDVGNGAGAGAQSPDDLARQFAGMWRLASNPQRLADGTTRESSNGIAYAFFDANAGHMCYLTMNPDRPLWKSETRPTPEEALSAIKGYGAYCATIEIHAKEGLMVRRYEINQTPNAVGKTTRRRYTFQGTNRLSLRVDDAELNPPVVESTYIWERVVK